MTVRCLIANPFHGYHFSWGWDFSPKSVVKKGLGRQHAELAFLILMIPFHQWSLIGSSGGSFFHAHWTKCYQNEMTSSFWQWSNLWKTFELMNTNPVLSQQLLINLETFTEFKWNFQVNKWSFIIWFIGNATTADIIQCIQFVCSFQNTSADKQLPI